MGGWPYWHLAADWRYFVASILPNEYAALLWGPVAAAAGYLMGRARERRHQAANQARHDQALASLQALHDHIGTGYDHGR